MSNETKSGLLPQEEIRSFRPAQQRSIKRIVLAIFAGYLANAILVACTELLLARILSNARYLVADIVTQCLIQAACGYLCARISNTTAAIAGLTVIGLLVGAISLAVSWSAEPHWYALALLLLYGPSVWAGYGLATGFRVALS